MKTSLLKINMPKRYLVPTIELIITRRILTLSISKQKVMVLKEFVLSEVCQLKKEAKTLPTSKPTSMKNRNSPDPANAEANELKKLEKKSSFLREHSQKKLLLI